MGDPLMKQNTQGRVYDKKPATIRDIAQDRDKRIWKAMCDNIESEPSYADMARRFSCSAGTIRCAIERIMETEDARLCKEYERVLELVNKRKVSCNRKGK